MKLYLLQICNPEEKEPSLDLMSEESYNQWRNEFKDVEAELDKVVEVIKIIKLTAKQSDKIKVRL